MKKLFLISTIFLFMDQISKILIRFFMNLYDTIIIIPKFLNITYVINNGAAFSMLEGKQLLFIILSIIIMISVVIYLSKNELKKIDYIIYGMLLGGILGNLIDRIIFHSVTDFIEFILFNNKMPIFNIADTFICISCFLLIFKEDLCKLLDTKKKRVHE